MSKKKLSRVAVAVMVLACTVLADVAAAKETKLKCEGTGPCTFTVAGGITNYSIEGGDTVKCESVGGSGSVTNLNAERESTTSTVQLLFKGCKEQNTIFHFNCQNTGTSGNVTTNVMTGHNIVLESGTKAGVLLTNAGVTFTCAGGYAPMQVTGSIIGESETKCGENTSTVQKLVFGTFGDGLQREIFYTGSTFRLEGETNHASGGVYIAASEEGTGTLTFNQNVILTCA